MIKKPIYSLALAGLLSLGMAGAALAQDNAAPPDQGPPPIQNGHGQRRMDPDQQLKRMTKQLDLTADQQAQIKPILVDRDQQMQQIFQDQSAPQDRRTKMRAIQDGSRAKIEAVLNDTQKQKYEQMEQHMHDHMRQRQQGGDESAPTPQQ